MPEKTAIIIGAGPGGLTAAYELLTRTDIHPVVLERSEYMGGIARTVRYKGNRLDLGGHRFFSKSDRVMQWWLSHLPVSSVEQAKHKDLLMLMRRRKSRIYFSRRFFDYPVKFTLATLRNFGFWRATRIAASYLRSAIFPIHPVNNLKEFFINRFGRELYLTFFKTYTEKVWGVPCEQIHPEWGPQRIKKLSIAKALVHFMRQTTNKKDQVASQQDTETSLIDRFFYPKLGSGQMWEEVARKIIAAGGEIVTGTEVDRVDASAGRIVAVSAMDPHGQRRRFAGDYFFSTTSVQELVKALGESVPKKVREIAAGLQYRDFITVGLLLSKLKLREPDQRLGSLIQDNWIYIHAPDVRIGRLQIFNNWSPYMVANPEQAWIGAEYFCNEGDDLWRKPDAEIVQLAIEELSRIEVIQREDVLDSTVARMPKAYPAYFGAYGRFAEAREYLDGFPNLFLIGRNGMHKYNNMDHSMLTAMTAVDNIAAGITTKTNVWAVNTEEEYHETKSHPAGVENI
jgi:protoporphyrinogen oxidase